MPNDISPALFVFASVTCLPCLPARAPACAGTADRRKQAGTGRPGIEVPSGFPLEPAPDSDRGRE